MATQVKPQDKTVTANGLNLHYLDWGTVGQPMMVLLHGLRGHAHSWDDFSAAMCQDYHVLALDQRGRGDSDWAKDGQYNTDAYVADFSGFCEALKLDSFILVGHSMGGRNSMVFTANNLDKVEKLVVVDMGPDIDPRGSERIRQELVSVPEEFDSLEAVTEYMSKQNRFASDSVMRRRIQYAIQQLPSGKIGWRYDKEIRESRRRGDVVKSADLWPVIAKISCPTLVVRGAETDILPKDTADKMIETMPNAKLVEVQRAAHMVFEDNPEDFLSAVHGFVG